MALKEYIVVNHGDAGVCLWIREQWLTHLADARKTSPGYDPPIITTFNADEQLQEQKGLRWVKASERPSTPWEYNTALKVYNKYYTGAYNPVAKKYLTPGGYLGVPLEDIFWLEETEPKPPVLFNSKTT